MLVRSHPVTFAAGNHRARTIGLQRAAVIALACVTAAMAVQPDDAVTAQEPNLLWQSGAPAEKGDIGAETNIPSTNKIDGRPFNQLGNVTKPSITLYPAPKDKATGAAVLVFPGGAYRILADDM